MRCVFFGFFEGEGEFLEYLFEGEGVRVWGDEAGDEGEGEVGVRAGQARLLFVCPFWPHAEHVIVLFVGDFVGVSMGKCEKLRKERRMLLTGEENFVVFAKNIENCNNHTQK